MGRLATNTSVQIQYLKDRGMIHDFDEGKIKEFLLDIGYYRLGFYWNPFEKDIEHNFKEGTKFSDVIKLYYLDVDLRHLLIKYINRIEINFRTKVVYYVSNKYKNSPTWFADPTIVNQKFSDVNNFYNEKFINTNKTIKNHHRKYINDKYAPAWKTLESLTFGAILTIYKNLKDEEIQKRISQELGIINSMKFINLMDTIILVRNMCAHGDILFDMRTPKGIAVTPVINFNNKNRNSLDSCIKVISYILGQISKNRQFDLESQIAQLFDKHKDNDNLKNIIISNINYQYPE